MLIICTAYQHGNRDGHATLAGTAVGRVDDAGDRALEHAVFHHQGMVLGFAQRLNAFAMSGGFGVNVQAHGGGADEGDAVDVRMG